MMFWMQYRVKKGLMCLVNPEGEKVLFHLRPGKKKAARAG